MNGSDDSPDTNGKTPRINTGELRSDIRIITSNPERNDTSRRIIFDPLSDTYYQIPEEMFRIISMLDRNYTLSEFSRKLELNGVKVKTETILEAINFLRTNGLTLSDCGTINEIQKKKKSAMERNRVSRMASGLLFMRLPTFRTGKFFSATEPFVSAVFSRGKMLWMLLPLAVTGYILLVRDWHEAAAMLINSISWSGMVKYSITIICLKIIHELAHGYVAAGQGVRVRGIGISLIFFFPRTYTDITDAWRLPGRGRMLIDSAGIAAEVIIGGIAALTWTLIPPGPLHSTMFFIFSVTVLNTLLVNGNPFMKFDGYYFLSDLVNIPNLQTQSNESIRVWWRRKLFGLNEKIPDENNRTFLFWYGVSSFAYRIFLYTSIILMIYAELAKILAVMLLILEIYTMFLLPLWQEARYILAKKREIGKLSMTAWITAAAVVMGILAIPLPWSIEMPCEIVPEHSSLITAKEGGFIKKCPDELEFNTGNGTLIIELESPMLCFDLKNSELDCLFDQTNMEYLRSDRELLAESQVIHEKMRADTIARDKLRHRLSLLSVTSPKDGRFICRNKKYKTGSWIAAGTILGEVCSPGLRADAYISANSIHRLNEGDSVKITLDGELGSIKGRITKISTAAARMRPSPLLNFYGGPIASYTDESGFFHTPVEPHFKVSIELDGRPELKNGRTGKAFVRKYTSVGASFARHGLAAIQKEFVF